MCPYSWLFIRDPACTAQGLSLPLVYLCSQTGVGGGMGAPQSKSGSHRLLMGMQRRGTGAHVVLSKKPTSPSPSEEQAEVP